MKLFSSLVVLVVIAVIVIIAPSSSPVYSAQVGLDIVDIGWRYWGFSVFGDGPASADKEMRDACSTANLTLVRFAATPFWPDQVKSSLLNNTAWYWQQFDALIASATKNKCKLVPSLFWNWFTFADIHHEHLGDALRNPASKTRGFMQQYVQQVLARYGKLDTIVAFELGNELSLIADLNMSGRKDSIAPKLGTPTTRTLADNISTDDMVNFELWLADEIRRNDPLQRPVSTGHSVPRDCAEHLRKSYHAPQRDWGPDTRSEFQKNLVDTSSCCELASIHYYPGSGARFGVTDVNSTAVIEVAAEALAAAQKNNNKFLYVGEFGNKDAGPRVFSHNVLNRLGEIQRKGILPHDRILSTIWVWEFFQFSKTEPAPYSLLPGRDDSMIQALRSFNDKYQ